MTRVVLDRSGRSLTLRGHAMSAKKGADLVCAALSALCCTLMAVPGAESELGEGYRRVLLPPGRECELETVCRGLRLLAADFPRCVSFEEERAGRDGEEKEEKG